MSRDELQRLIEKYSADGGTVTRFPELLRSKHMESRFRELAKQVGEFGHRARRRARRAS